MCSKKAYQHVKMCRLKPKKCRIDVKSNDIHLKNENFWINPLARIQRYPSLSPPKTEIVEFNGYEMPVHFDRRTTFCLFWEDEVLGLKIVTDYICNLFKINVHGAIIEKSNLWIIDWLNSRQESYAMIEIEGFNRPALNDKEYRHILTDCRATDHLKLTAAASDDFKFTGNFPKTEILSISPSRWVTLENLKAIDSINILLWESSLTSSDMNLFLKHWLDGGSPRLSCMSVSTTPIHREDIFIGLKNKFVSKMRTFRLVDGRSDYFNESYDIERKDGAKVSVLLNELGNRGIMWIVVWPATE